MIELKTLEIEAFRFIDISLFLPRWTCRMIVSTKAVLVDESWDLDALEEKKIPVFQVYKPGKTGLLDGKITAMTSTAACAGIYIGMSGKEALLKVMHEKTEKG